MINEKEMLCDLFVGLSKAQENFSKVHNKNLSNNPTDYLSDEAIDIINSISVLLSEYNYLLQEKYNINTYELLLKLDI